jgi:predicted acylesterase/phospholipase RssA/CRP-like cAMP-binding protein
VELQRLDWASQLDERVIREIANASELMEFETGQSVIPLGSEVTHVYFVLTGRLSGTLFDRIGKSIRSDVFVRGSVVGLFSLLLSEQSYIQVEAVEPTAVVRLTLDELLHLTGKHRDFQLAMFRIAAGIVKHIMTVDRNLPKPAVVGVIHHSDESRSLTAQLTRRLRELGESPCVAGDDDRWRPEGDVPYRLLYEKGELLGREEVKQQLQEWSSFGRLFVDLGADHSVDDLRRALSYSDLVLWCVRPQDIADAMRKLQALESDTPRLREKVRIVWALSYESPVPPYAPELVQLAAGDFKTFSGEPQPNQGQLFGQGIERIVRHLRGVKIGLALGGGAARGMAHLGVLSALERNGIFVDMIAGTSAGAMTGTLYASGIDPMYTAQCFKKDLRPSWFFRQLPAGGYWYLLHQYRRHRFDPMLRRYLSNLRMEQLAVPMLTIAVDLVDGVSVIRDSGDATDNILESINLPPLSMPIVRSEQALIDGGLLNNVPANELVARGCNFVIASTVTANIEKDFMSIRSKKKAGMGQYFATLQVVMRCNLIQGYSMNAVGVKPADFVIAPDVTSFDLAEFTRADEMAVVGEAAADTSIAELKSMLSRLDARLFQPESA